MGISMSWAWGRGAPRCPPKAQRQLPRFVCQERGHVQARPGASEPCHLTPPDQLFLPRLKGAPGCQRLLVKPQEQAQNHLQPHTWLREHTLIRNGPAMREVASLLNPRSHMSPQAHERMVVSNPCIGSPALCFLSTQEYRAESTGPLNRIAPHPCSPPDPLLACHQEVCPGADPPPLPSCPLWHLLPWGLAEHTS